MDSMHLLGLILAMLVVGILYLLFSVGYFHKVKVTAGRSIVPHFEFAYSFHIGKYSECGPHFEKITKLCPDLVSFGIYYDDPKEVEGHKCRYITAVIVAEGKQRPDPAVVEKLQENGFKFSRFPEVEKVMKASHPLASWSPGISAYIAATKTYPLMMEFLKKEGLTAHPYLEIYKENMIHYMAPLSKHESFYVHEVEDMVKSPE